MASEHGVTFEWASGDPEEPWRLGESIAVGLLYPFLSKDAHGNGGRSWYMALAANLAVAALLGAAARQATEKATRCDFPGCNREMSEPLCPIHDNDE